MKDVTASELEGSSPALRAQEKIRDELRSLYLEVHLDGRNEFGSHVIPMGSTSIDRGGLEEIETLLADQDLGFAEHIISDAETMGHSIGHVVVTVWTVHRDYEWGAEWEYCRISDILTDLICGPPSEQRSRIELHEPRGLSAAEPPTSGAGVIPNPESQ